jgi:hypothetical protein
MKDAALWTRLLAHDFALSGAGATLSAKVVHETTLNASKAATAVDEYRRFLYLAATSATPVAPSQVVNAVWQCHVTDTRAYVDALCNQVIGCMIHNDAPAAAPINDPAYARTLALYAKEFGIAPPPKVWPDAAALGYDRIVGGFAVAGLVLGGLGWASGEMLTVGIGVAMILGACAWWVTMAPWHAGKRETGSSDSASGGSGSSDKRDTSRDESNDTDSGGDGGGD